MRARLLVPVVLIFILQGCGYARKFDIGAVDCNEFVLVLSQDDGVQKNLPALQEETLQDVLKIAEGLSDSRQRQSIISELMRVYWLRDDLKNAEFTWATIEGKHFRGDYSPAAMMVRIYLKHGNYDRALELARDEHVDSQRKNLLELVAGEFIRHGNISRGEKIWREAFDFNAAEDAPNHMRRASLVGLIASAGEFDRARQILRSMRGSEVAKRFRISALVSIAKAQFRKGLRNDALETLEQAEREANGISIQRWRWKALHRVWQARGSIEPTAGVAKYHVERVERTLANNPVDRVFITVPHSLKWLRKYAPENSKQIEKKIADAISNSTGDVAKSANRRMAGYLTEFSEIGNALEYLYRASPKPSPHYGGVFSKIISKLIELDRQDEAQRLLTENGLDPQNCTVAISLANGYNAKRDSAAAHRIMQAIPDYGCISDGARGIGFGLTPAGPHDPSQQAIVVAMEEKKYRLACTIFNQARLDITRDEGFRGMLLALATSGKSKAAIDLAGRVRNPYYRAQALTIAAGRP